MALGWSYAKSPPSSLLVSHPPTLSRDRVGFVCSVFYYSLSAWVGESDGVCAGAGGSDMPCYCNHTYRSFASHWLSTPAA